MKRNYFILILCFQFLFVFGQEEYIGSGNTEGVTVRASSSYQNSHEENSINGKGMDAKRMEATRFLAQSTLGFKDSHVDQVLHFGIEGWIDVQQRVPQSLLLPTLESIYSKAERVYNENAPKGSDGNPEDEYYGPWGLHFNYAWWQTNMTNEDLLRQRVALALSEILVISMNSDLQDFGEGLSDYYDLMVKHAFGNYKELLTEVTFHPCMGYYLSHLHNQKSDPENNINPDENYAREIMQLFTIGLYELNEDGTHKLDDEGKSIPTYDNTDIKEMAKIFTGLGVGEWSKEGVDLYIEYNDGRVPPPFFNPDAGIYATSRTDPMRMYNDFHEPGEKTILKNHIIPAGQSGTKDIEDAIDILINHNNTGPFLSRHLIQRLIKSNPSPDYIRRISKVFADNGSGERGDLGAMIKAILLDEEARSCEWLEDPYQGMLREPITRFTHLLRVVPKDAPLGNFWNNGFFYRELTKQHPLISPTVFNFFLPDYQPVGDFAKEGLVGPEFQIHDTQTSIGYINHVNLNTVYEVLFWSWENNDYWGEDLNVRPSYETMAQISNDTEELINYIDIMFTHGRLSDDTRNIIRKALEPINGFDGSNKERLKAALYLVLISPDYTILK